MRVISLLFCLVSTVQADSLETRTNEERYFDYINIAVKAYKLDCGELPRNKNELLYKTSACKNWGGPYISKMKDTWGNEYLYQRKSDNEYGCISLGPDGKLGTKDDQVKKYNL